MLKSRWLLEYLSRKNFLTHGHVSKVKFSKKILENCPLKFKLPAQPRSIVKRIEKDFLCVFTSFGIKNSLRSGVRKKLWLFYDPKFHQNFRNLPVIHLNCYFRALTINFIIANISIEHLQFYFVHFVQ